MLKGKNSVNGKSPYIEGLFLVNFPNQNILYNPCIRVDFKSLGVVGFAITYREGKLATFLNGDLEFSLKFFI